MAYPNISQQHKSNDVMYLSGKDAMYPDIIVQTQYSLVKKMITDPEQIRTAREVFPQVWNNIKNVDTDALYAAGGQPWTDFMNDIVIFYVCRYHIFAKPMPMVRKCDLHKAVKKIKTNKGEVDLTV